MAAFLQVEHLPADEHPLQPLGLERLKSLVALAEDRGVQLAFENLRNLRNLSLVLETFPFRCVGFCYDSCHHRNYAAGQDLLAQYGGAGSVVLFENDLPDHYSET